MNTITLFRGDFEKISKFDVDKTDKNCLYGQGIYLTEDPAIADTYRIKGANHSQLQLRSGILWEGICANRNEAAQFAFEIFAALHVVNGQVVTGGKTNAKGKFKNLSGKHISQAKELWHDVREELIISRTELPLGKVHHVVKWKRITLAVGYVTKFVFPREELVNNTVTMELPLYRQGVQDVFIDCPCDWSLCKLIQNNKIAKNALRRKLEPWGYLGVSHTGGFTTGNRHKVFILWDNNYVNRHKTGLHRVIM